MQMARITENIKILEDFIAILDNFYSYGVLKEDGNNLDKNFVRVTRDRNVFELLLKETINGIYFCKIPVVQKENVCVIDNTTTFNDLIFDPASGYKQDRIKVLELKRDKINTISPSFCSAKWLQTSLYLQNGFNHSYHHPSAHKIPVEEVLANPAALHNSKYKKQQRAKMLNGERPSECDYCWKIEDLDKNYFSDRHYKTADWWAWDRVDEIAKSSPADDVFPSYLEVSFSNACNFACAYCSPDISSTWMDDIEEHGSYPVQNGNHDLEYLKSVGKIPYKRSEENPYMDAWFKWMPEVLPHLKVFRVTGGEPTMSKDVWRTLDYIMENPQPQLQLAINTNLGTHTKLIDKLIDYINKLEDKVERIDVYTSVESVGQDAN